MIAAKRLVDDGCFVPFRQASLHCSSAYPQQSYLSQDDSVDLAVFAEICHRSRMKDRFDHKAVPFSLKRGQLVRLVVLLSPHGLLLSFSDEGLAPRIDRLRRQNQAHRFGMKHQRLFVLRLSCVTFAGGARQS